MKYFIGMSLPKVIFHFNSGLYGISLLPAIIAVGLSFEVFAEKQTWPKRIIVLGSTFAALAFFSFEFHRCFFERLGKIDIKNKISEKIFYD